jgi:hypothetical protein
VALKYKTAMTAKLRVSTDNPGTGMGMSQTDTVVMVLDACSATGTVLGCNDDSGSGFASTATTDVTVNAGTEVYIVVGVYSTMMTPGTGGPFELTVEELELLPMNAECDTGLDLCPAGQSCAGTAQVGKCTDDGTAVLTRCRPDGDPNGRCDMPLTCVVGQNGNPDICKQPASQDGPCDFLLSQCPTDNICIPTFTTTTQKITSGICRQNGTVGGLCGSDVGMGGTNCPMGSTCSDTNQGFCQVDTAAGVACDPVNAFFSPTKCAAGTTCAFNVGGGNFTCQADGTVAGSACRAMDPKCDGALTCSAMMGGFCEGSAVGGGTCQPHLRTTACTGGTVCIATDYTAGTCGTATAEQMGDHATYDTAQAVPLINGSVAVAGTMTADTEVDCYSVSVNAGETLFADVGDGNGGCPGDSVVVIYDPQGRAVAVNDESPLDSCSSLFFTASAAGTYAICVTPYQGFFGGTAIPNYVLSIKVGN